jgi:hypothetical protein
MTLDSARAAAIDDGGVAHAGPSHEVFGDGWRVQCLRNDARSQCIEDWHQQASENKKVSRR